MCGNGCYDMVIESVCFTNLCDWTKEDRVYMVKLGVVFIFPQVYINADNNIK